MSPTPFLSGIDPAFALSVVLKATVLLGAAWAASRVLARRRASAAARHLVWTLAVAGLLVLPLLSAALPGWRVGAVRLPAVVVAPPARVPASGAPVDEGPVFTAASPAPGAGPVGAANVEDAPPWWSGVSWGAAAAGVYLAGVLALLAWLAAGQWGLRRLARRAEPVTDREWKSLLLDLTWMMDVDRPVVLLRSRAATMPMTWGVRRPVILLPVGADAWPEERRRVVLLHELAHVARHDCLTQALASLACALYWFHPGAWHAARRLRVEREVACDDRVLAAGTRAREYAAHLLEVARDFRPAPRSALVAVSMARPSQLEGRLLAVLDTVRSRRGLSRRLGLGATAAALALLLPLAAVRPGEARAAQGPRLFATVDEPSGAAQDHVWERHVAARPGGSLRVTLQTGGSVRIVGWDRPTVLVNAELSGPDWRSIRMGLEGGDSGVELTSRFTGRQITYEVRQEIEVRVPRSFDVEVQSEGGYVEIRGVTGDFAGTTEGGPLHLVNAAGTIRFRTEGGPVEIRDTRLSGRIVVEGGAVTAGRNEGDLDIEGGGDIIDVVNGGTYTVGEDRDANTLHAGGARDDGDEELPIFGEAGRPVAVARPGGPIHVAEAPAGAVLKTGGGEIVVESAAGRVRAETGGGDVRIEALRGGAHVTTGAGDVGIRLVEGARGDVEVYNGSGAVTVSLPEGFDGELDLESAYTRGHGRTRIHSDLPLRHGETDRWEEPDGSSPRRYVKASGRVGSGRGSRVLVRTINGDIRVIRGGRLPGGGVEVHPGDDGRSEADAKAVELYRLALRERDGNARAQAVRALAGLPDDEGFDELVALARRHPDAGTRRQVVQLLGERGCDESVAALEQIAYRDADVAVQLAAVDALTVAAGASTAEAGDSDYVPPRLEKVKRTHPAARVRARAGAVLNELSRGRA